MNMKKRIALEFFVTLILIADLLAISLYFKEYIFIPFVILMVMSLYKFKYLFYDYLDYTSNSKFVVYRENFILFSLYIFKDGKNSYIDDGYYFCKNRDNNNLKLDYTIQDEEIKVVFKRSFLKLLHAIVFLPVLIRTVVICININKITDGGSEFLLFLFFSIVNLLVLVANMESRNKIKIKTRECNYLGYSTVVDLNWNWLNFSSCNLIYRENYDERKLLDSKNYWFLYFVRSELERIGKDGI